MVYVGVRYQKGKGGVYVGRHAQRGMGGVYVGRRWQRGRGKIGDAFRFFKKNAKFWLQKNMPALKAKAKNIALKGAAALASEGAKKAKQYTQDENPLKQLTAQVAQYGLNKLGHKLEEKQHSDQASGRKRKVETAAIESATGFPAPPVKKRKKVGVSRGKKRTRRRGKGVHHIFR